MMEQDMTETLERARCALVRHLGELMDEVEHNDGRITSRRMLGGIHETVETLSVLGDMPGGATGGKPSVATGEKARA